MLFPKTKHRDRCSWLCLVARSTLVICSLLVFSDDVNAAPCTRVKANPDRWVTTKVDALVRSARAAYINEDAQAAYEKTLDGIVATIDRCRLAEEHDFKDRYLRFFDYVETVAFERLADHELGFAVPDEQYFAETRQFVEIPDYLLAQSFLRHVSRYETLERAKDYLRQVNSSRPVSGQLVFFSYKSRHLGTPDNDFSFRRLLVVVPGNVETGIPEKWIQFGVTDPGARTRIRNVSIVSALRRTDGTYDVYFKDSYRSYGRNGRITLKGRWELGEGDDNCASCHKSGVLPIFPARGSVSAAEQDALNEVNERFKTYGSPRFGKYLDTSKLGPGLSSATIADRARRYGDDFPATRAAKAMVCSSCHQPSRLGSLNWPMDRVLISSYIKGGQMPFGHQLAVGDRRELHRKLVHEYFATDKDHPGILKSWLLGQPQSAQADK